MQSKIAILLLGLLLFMSACGDSKKASTDPTDSISGNWLISLTDTADTKALITQSGSLVETNNVVTGTLAVTNEPCSGVGSVQGSVAGTAVSLTVNPVGTEIILTGTTGPGSGCANNQTCMGGSYTALSTGCTELRTVPSTGTWSANLIAPLNGSITGSFVSTTGVSYPVTGKVSQGANSGGSSTPLSGSLSFAGGFCYATANIVGSISGTSVVMNLADTDGTQIGQAFGTLSLDGTSLTGSYHYMGLGKGAATGCVDGASGTTTLQIAGQ